VTLGEGVGLALENRAVGGELLKLLPLSGLKTIHNNLVTNTSFSLLNKKKKFLCVSVSF
jgi:hypothetical protein